MTNYPIVKRAHKTHDEKLQMVRQQRARDGEPVVISCHRKCFACCKEPVYAFIDEVRYISESVTNEQRAEVTERTKEWLEKFKQTDFPNQDLPNVFEYRAANLWCPFLKNGLCTVYDRRPLGCRSHMAVGPAKDCDDDERRRKQKFISVPDIMNLAMPILA